jgi:hypothetical protein
MRIGRSLLGAVAVALVVAGCRTAEAWTQYGEELTLSDTTRIADVLADPDTFVGQRLLVTGTIVAVCEMRGCWMELAGENESETLRVKVEDGVIVFPMSARGLTAVVEGVMERLELSEAEALERARNHAEEQGEEFDPSTVTGPVVSYQLRGIGAVIKAE